MSAYSDVKLSRGVTSSLFNEQKVFASLKKIREFKIIKNSLKLPSTWVHQLRMRILSYKQMTKNNKNPALPPRLAEPLSVMSISLFSTLNYQTNERWILQFFVIFSVMCFDII